MPTISKELVDFTEKSFTNKYTIWCYENIIRAINRGSAIERAVLAAGQFGYTKMFGVIYFQPTHDWLNVDYLLNLIERGQHCLLKCEVSLAEFILDKNVILRPESKFFYMDIDEMSDNLLKERFIKKLENSGKIVCQTKLI